MNMTRRDAVIKLAVLMGASLVGPRLLARNFGLATPLDYSTEDIALLDEIGETIIPATSIPGAKAAGTGAFIAMCRRLLRGTRPSRVQGRAGAVPGGLRGALR